MKRILYCGWIGHNNLGDEFMWYIFHKLCKKYFSKEEVKVVPTAIGMSLKDLRKYDLVVLGGGSLISQYYINIIYRASKLNIPIIVWGSGVDRIGREKMQDLLQTKEKKRFSIYLTPDIESKLKTILPSIQNFGVRGPLTWAVINNIKLDTKNVTIVGDPGILINESYMMDQKTTIPLTITPPTIAVNWGTANNQIYGQNELKIRSQIASALKVLCAQGYNLILYSVWKEDIPSLQKLKKLINNNEQVQIWLKPNEQQLLKMLGSCVYSINFKLHANILSFASGTPAMAVGYRFKVYDFYHSIKQEKLILPSYSKDFTDEVLKRHEYILNNHSTILTEYKQYEEMYKKKLLDSFFQIKTYL